MMAHVRYDDVDHLRGIVERKHPGLRCLGVGCESAVFTDGKTVYKTFRGDPIFYGELALKLKGRFDGCRRFFPIDYESIDGTVIITYDYHESVPYCGGREDEIVEFLVESALCGVVFRDVKPSNLRLFKDGVRFIDYGRDFVPYSESEFLFMCQRAFIGMTEWANPHFKEIVNRAQHTWKFDDPHGFLAFFNKVYSEYLSRKQIHPQIGRFQVGEGDWMKDVIRSSDVCSESLFILSEMSGDLSSHGIASPEDIHGDNVAIIIDEFLPPDQQLGCIRAGVPVGGNVLLTLRNPFFGGSNSELIRLLEDSGLAVIDTAHSPPRPSEDGMSSRYISCRCRRFEPITDVSLMIKACYQDSKVIGRLVRHIVSQLEGPDHFLEKIVVIDGKDDDFLRQYADPDRESTLSEMESLMRDGVIDKYLIAPNDPDVVSRINREWFDVECSNTHSIRNIPVTPSLWGFEQCNGRYVLQTDCDAIIVRRDRSHQYLRDMRDALEDDDVLSVSFNIAHDPEKPKVDYSGCFCPEVRICLFDRQRFLDHRPYPNSVVEGRLELSWYRSMERYQNLTGCRSVRGGDPRTFYIHPQNDRKSDIDSWMNVLEMAEFANIPPVQFESVDLCGTEDDWKPPSRDEQFIFIICGRNLSNERFLRCWESLRSQRCHDWGAIIVDDASTNGMDRFIIESIHGHGNVTFIRNRSRRFILSNIVRSIRELCSDPTSVIITLDMDDALLSKDALFMISKAYLSGKDMVSSTCLRKDKGIYPYPVDFKDVRKGRMGNIWLHMRTFRKYLFDAIDTSDFMDDGEWIDEFNELSFMVPMAEMSSDPIQIPVPLYLWEPGRVRDDYHYRMNEHTRRVIESRPPYDGSFADIPSGRILPPGMVVSQSEGGDIIVICNAESADVPSIPSGSLDITPRGEDDSMIMGSNLVGFGPLFVSYDNRSFQTARSLIGDADIIPDELITMISRRTKEDDIHLLHHILRISEGCRPILISDAGFLQTLMDIMGMSHGHRIEPLFGVVLKRADVLMRLFSLEASVDDGFHPADRYSVEIDVTYRCNLMCHSCDRSCGNAPDESDMSVDQIKEFVRMSEEIGHDWRRIRIMGGEPFLHPEIKEILGILSDYGIRHPDCEMEIYTNGIHDYGVDVPDNVKIHNTRKTGPVNRFDPYNVAPRDLNSAYTGRGCWISSECGLGLNLHGFYCCAAGAAIDRVFGLNIPVDRPDDIMLEKQKDVLCPLCGHGIYPGYRSRDERPWIGDVDMMSDSWIEAYRSFRILKPDLGRWRE